jgi:hypothetical protein
MPVVPGALVERQIALPLLLVGAPSDASATRGAELVEQLVEVLAELLKRARAERDPEL